MADVRLSGPLFDGRVEADVPHAIQEALDQVAGQGLADVHMNLDTSIRHPTPYYETQIRVEAAGNDRSVNDRGIIYGPWLEGVGSRNITTHFKGYASFRRAAQSLEHKAQGLTQAVFDQHEGRWN